MSPSEDELRRALRHGQDDAAPDVAAIVAAGRSARARRRTLLSAAAAAVVVAGVGVLGATALNGHDPSGRSSAAAAEPANGSADAAGAGNDGTGARRNGSTPTLPADGMRTATTAPCPTALPTLLLPGGGGTGQFGAAGKLFATAPSAMVVCRYAQDGTVVAAVRLDAGRSAALTTELESADYHLAPRLCARSQVLPRLAFVGLSAQGGTLPVVTAVATEPSCGYTLTNGTAVRYEWQLPSDLHTALDVAASSAAGSRVPAPQVSLPVVSPGSGRNQGSPVR